MSRAQKFKEYAATARVRVGFDATNVKFSGETGKWTVGKDVDVQDFNGRELLADVGDLLRGYRKFTADRMPVPVYAVARVDSNIEPPPREALGDLDQRTWPKNRFSDTPKDPWSWVSILPLIDCATGETLVYATETSGGHDAIATLADAFAVRPEDSTQLPMVALASCNKLGSTGRRYFFPILRILRWEGRPSDARHLQPPPLPLPAASDQGALPLGGNGSVPAGTGNNGRARGMADDIPF